MVLTQEQEVKRYILYTILALSIACAGQTTKPHPQDEPTSTGTPRVAASITKAHNSAHRIGILAVGEGELGSCSGTAIGPHALLTATHCSSPSAVVSIDGNDADVLGTMGDGLDHTIILVSATFKDYVDVAARVNLDQSEEIFVFGNPGPFKDVYRKGYVAGFNKPEKPETALQALTAPKQHAGNDGVKVTFYDLNGFFGDSGSALFNLEGKIVGVTSFIVGAANEGYTMKYMGSYELRISKEQFKQAREFNPPAPPAVTPEETKSKKSILDWFSGK
jgi:hypothetical protein